MNKSCFVIAVFTVLLHSGASLGADTYKLPTSDQIARLVAAGWEPAPRSIDISLCKEVIRPSRGEAQIRSEVTSLYERMDFRTPGEKSELIESEIRRLAEQDGKPILLKQRIRIRDHLYRLDQTVVSPGTGVGEGTSYQQTYVNCGNANGDDTTHFNLDHRLRRANISNSSAIWGRHSANEWGGLSSAMRGFLQFTLGKPDNSGMGAGLVPDNDAIARLTRGQPDKFRLVVEETMVLGSGVDRFTFVDINTPQRTLLSIAVDQRDYTRVYREEMTDPNGNPRHVREATSFGPDGYPREITVTDYDGRGQVTNKERIAISEVYLDVKLLDEVFKFEPPHNYIVIDERLSPPLVMHPIEDSLLLGALATHEAADYGGQKDTTQTGGNDRTRPGYERPSTEPNEAGHLCRTERAGQNASTPSTLGESAGDRRDASASRRSVLTISLLTGLLVGCATLVVFGKYAARGRSTDCRP